jgi:dihydropyrimidinase
MRTGNWPRWVVVRGDVKWDRENGGLKGKPSDGLFLKRGKGKLLVGRTGGEVIGMKDGERDLCMDRLDR